MLKKMGWSGAGGLGANEHGIQGYTTDLFYLDFLLANLFHYVHQKTDPISAGEVRDKVDQYKGIGTRLAANDPYESYRRNKGQAYIQRIRDNRSG